MNTLREAAQQALEALEALQGSCTDSNDGTVESITVWCPEVIDALKAALAEPTGKDVLQVEPAAWRCKGEPWFDGNRWHDKFEVMEYLRAALAQPDTEMPKTLCGPNLEEVLNTAGFFKRKPLTEDEIDAIAIYYDGLPNSFLELARAIEAAHGIR